MIKILLSLKIVDAETGLSENDIKTLIQHMDTPEVFPIVIADDYGYAIGFIDNNLYENYEFSPTFRQIIRNNIKDTVKQVSDGHEAPSYNMVIPSDPNIYTKDLKKYPDINNWSPDVDNIDYYLLFPNHCIFIW